MNLKVYNMDMMDDIKRRTFYILLSIVPSKMYHRFDIIDHPHTEGNLIFSIFRFLLSKVPLTDVI